MNIVYRKTAKGITEIETRAHRLTPRLRNALILVDGRRTGETLATLVTVDAAGALASLLADGFIEDVLGLAEPVRVSEALPAEVAIPAIAVIPAIPAIAAEEPPAARDTPAFAATEPNEQALPSPVVAFSVTEPSELSIPLLSTAFAATEPNQLSRPSVFGLPFEVMRREAMHQLDEDLGVNAETLNIKIGRSASMSELQALLARAVLIQRRVHGEAAADAFAERFGVVVAA